MCITRMSVTYNTQSLTYLLTAIPPREHAELSEAQPHSSEICKSAKITESGQLYAKATVQTDICSGTQLRLI
jgi:hypothetical protein